MGKENNILNVINEVKEVLQKSHYTKKRYEHDIKWFSEKEDQVLNNIVRIAIMGITSSGKSTLVNAIIGEKLLPIAIKPSSSIIITCAKGQARQAVIYFRDKKHLVIKKEELNDEIIRKYADETENPNNKLNVSQIHISSPKFLLGENIHIIDSPGLDACDLEIHEKITMEVLLPTIDICIFLTTVKANNDEINVEKIRMVSEKGKEMILVQNMIDSVEGKIGKNGIIEEDKFELLEKHKKRGINLLKVGTMSKNSYCNNKGNFVVVQISALNALKGLSINNKELYEKSNMENLLREIQKCVQNIMPKIDTQRIVGLVCKINNIISTDKKLIDESNGEYINSFNIVTKDIVDGTFREFKMLKGNILSRIGKLDNIISCIINDINNLDSKKVDSYLNLIEKINLENSQIENEILHVVKECENNKNELYNKLNLDIRYSYSIPSMNYESVDIMHKYEEKTQLIKKEGVFNKGKRMLSNAFDKNWGYEEKVLDEKVIDKDATIIELENVCNVNRVKYISVINEWSKQYTRSINLFYNEISKKGKELLIKRNQDIKLDHIQYVKDNLLKIANNLFYDEANVKKEVAIELHKIEKYENSIELKDIDEHVKCTISKNNYNLYKIMNIIIEKNYLLIGNYINDKTSKNIGEKVTDIFWIWDLNVSVTFISRITNIYLSEEDINKIKENGIYNHNNIIIIYEDGINKIRLYEKLKVMYGGKYNIYVIFNGIQIGNSEKQVMKNFSLKEFILNNKVVTNLVIDSCKEFINGNNTLELLLEVDILKKKMKEMFTNKKIGYILINSKNPIYNMALIEGQEKENFIIGDYKEIKERLLKNILCKGTEEKDTIEDILSYFLKYTK